MTFQLDNAETQGNKMKTTNGNLHCSKGDASGKNKLEQIICKS